MPTARLLRLHTNPLGSAKASRLLPAHGVLVVSVVWAGPLPACLSFALPLVALALAPARSKLRGKVVRSNALILTSVKPVQLQVPPSRRGGKGQGVSASNAIS